MSENNFVHSVSFSDGVMSVVGTNQQLNDVLRFCANDNPGFSSVLGNDLTFNLGDFYVTPTVYENMMVKNKVIGKHASFIGPALIH